MFLNKAIIIGNLTRDPELKSLPSGTAVVSFGVATNRVWKNQQGEKQEDAQFHNIVAFGKQAEVMSQYLKKGNMVMIEGRIQTRNWDAQDGTKKSRTEIVVENFQFGPKSAGGGGGGSPSGNGGGYSQQIRPSGKPQAAPKEELATIQYPEEEVNPEEIPF